MNKKEIEDEIKNRYKHAISDEIIKSKYIKKDKSIHIAYIISYAFILTLFVLICVLGIFEATEKSAKLALLFLAVVLFMLDILIFIILLKANKKTDNERILRQIKNEVQIEISKNKYIINIEKIKSVSIIDSYTKMSDKLHAILNYQEIIQTRYYKFKIVYKDGTSQIITTEENSSLYNKLIVLTDSKENHEIDVSEELKKYKQLLDEGIITQEEYNMKKKEILKL